MRIKKRTLWIIAIFIILAIGAGGWFYFQDTAVTTAAQEENQVQTATVRQGNITISATGAGNVIPATEINLAFQTSGILQTLNVRVGDEVAVGDVLAALNNSDAQQSLANAELQLTQSQLQIDGSTTETGVSYNDISIQQAQINLDTAQNNLQDLLNWEPDADEILKAEASLASAEATYSAALGQEAASSSSLQIEAINLNQVERDLADAQEAYNVAHDPGRDWELNDPRRASQLESERERTADALLRAQENLTIAQTSYNASISTTNNSSSIGAESNLLNAQIALEDAQSGPSAEEIEAAETAVFQAELALNQAILNREADLINLEQAKLNLSSAQEALSDAVLVATMGGTVLSIEGELGEQVSTSTFITLADLTQPLIELFLDESDFASATIGNEVTVTFDALPDIEFSGEIILVDPQLTAENNVTVIRAVAQLDAGSLASAQSLPVGLNATVEVIGGQANNTLLVPIEAVREISPGQFAVFIMENDEPKLTFVEVGLQDFTFAEILSGVEAGDIVTTGLVETE
ncbi:MAG: efflux RND transporter periplasmic adaptor subunit [Chloroflexota bacterium]